MRFFRLLHRRTKSENDVSTLLFQPCSAGITAPVFVPLQASLPSFDPTRELYASPADSVRCPVDQGHIEKLNARIIELEAQLAHLQDERSTLEQDLVDYRTDLLQTRTELYSEMLRSSRHQQQSMDDFRTIQKLEARHQRFCNMLVDTGIPRSTVEVICQVIQSGNGSAEDVLVDAIKDASNDGSTLLARLKPTITEERTPEHYQSALNLTLSIRKELKSQKKRSKFWKKLAQEDDRHANTVTPSPSDISSIRQGLSPGRQSALDALIARRRAAKHSETTEGDVFGGQRESTLDSLASSLASRPRRSIPDDLRLSSSFSSSASSASTTYHSYLAGLSRIPRDSATETPTVASRLQSTLSTSLRRSFRSSTQFLVLGSINLNVSRSSIDPTLQETEQNMNPDAGATSTVTLSQDLLQNSRRASQGQGHRRMPSTASRRSVPTRSTRSSFRLSAFSPIRARRPTSPTTVPDSDISGNTTTDAPSFHTPDIMHRLSDLALATSTDTDTPASSEVTGSEDTPFNDALALPKYGTDTPLSPTDLEARVASTPSDAFVIPCQPLCVEMSVSMTMSASTSVSASEASGHAHEVCEHEHARGCEGHAETDTGTGTIPLGESNDSLFTTSASAASSSLTANDTPAPTTPPTPSPSSIPIPGLSTPPRSTCDGTGIGTGISTVPGSGSDTSPGSVRRSMLPVLAKHLRRLSLSGSPDRRDRLVDKLRGLRSLSRASTCSVSRSRSGSVGSGSGSGLVSGSGIGLSSGQLPLANGVWRGSPARSESSRSAGLTTSPSPSPVKGSGIPVLQRRMTIRARMASVRKV